MRLQEGARGWVRWLVPSALDTLRGFCLASGVAVVVGGVDVVGVVASAVGYRGGVFGGVALVVGCFVCGVDGFSVGGAGLVFGFSFGFDEFWCGVAFEVRFGFVGFCGACLVWVVWPSYMLLLANVFPVGLVVLAFVFVGFVCVGFVVLAFVFVGARLVCLCVFAVVCRDFLSVVRVSAVASLSFACL